MEETIQTKEAAAAAPPADDVGATAPTPAAAPAPPCCCCSRPCSRARARGTGGTADDAGADASGAPALARRPLRRAADAKHDGSLR